ncbi:MAG: hypothetical protein QXS20_06290 [Candidatus Thorarchaeota archaeon]
MGPSKGTLTRAIYALLGMSGSHLAEQRFMFIQAMAPAIQYGHTSWYTEFL